jgi:hypothetical protein
LQISHSIQAIKYQNMSTYTIISGITAFVWFGFICSISFLEAPVKFRAPGVTLPIGLAIGKKVFSALNKTEIGFMIILGATAMLKTTASHLELVYPSVILVILLCQSAWLLPALGKRVLLIQSGITPPPSRLHWYYIGGELLKMICLFIYGLMQWKY